MTHNTFPDSFSIHQKIQVTFDYPVHFTKNLFHPSSPLLADTIDRLHEERRHRVLPLIDAGLADAQPQLIDRIFTYLKSHPQRLEPVAAPFLIPGGETTKTDPHALDALLELIGNDSFRLCRQSFVLAVGGGSFLDLAGLATALVHRGLRLIRVPSTVLAQNDSAVGVKNGIDRNGQKNFLGTFAPPFAVLCDSTLLDTLPDKYWRGGIAEAFKVAIIRDAAFLEFLCRNASALKDRNPGLMEELIRRCALLHLDHIRLGGDPFETGAARPLDFGHWAAHKIEGMSNCTFGHGLAVAVGLALDSCYAAEINLLDTSERDRIIQGLLAAGLPIWTPLLNRRDSNGRRELLRGLTDFQEHLGGRLTLAMPKHIGHQTSIHEVDPSLIESIILRLERYACT